MASRGSLGGLAVSTRDTVRALDAAGFDVVIIETVGAGQAEVEIVRAAQTVVVVTVPGMGDDIQAIKAGILEIADIFVVNKADRPGADQTAAELRMLLSLDDTRKERAWRVPILKTSASTGEGVPELADKLAAHLAALKESGQLGGARWTPGAERDAGAAAPGVGRAYRGDDWRGGVGSAGGGGCGAAQRPLHDRRAPCRAHRSHAACGRGLIGLI